MSWAFEGIYRESRSFVWFRFNSLEIVLGLLPSCFAISRIDMSEEASKDMTVLSFMLRWL